MTRAPRLVAAQTARVTMLAKRHEAASEHLTNCNAVAAEFHRYTAEMLHELAQIIADGAAA